MNVVVLTGPTIVSFEITPLGNDPSTSSVQVRFPFSGPLFWTTPFFATCRNGLNEGNKQCSRVREGGFALVSEIHEGLGYTDNEEHHKRVCDTFPDHDVAVTRAAVHDMTVFWAHHRAVEITPLDDDHT